MKERFYLFKRNGIYYVEDGATGRQQSLKTKEGTEARRILHAKNEAVRFPTLNIAMARVYLTAHDPKTLERTWQDVMDEFCRRGKQQTQEHRGRVAKRRPQSLLRNMKLIETTADGRHCGATCLAAAAVRAVLRRGATPKRLARRAWQGSRRFELRGGFVA
jgi:hypothetical protein